MLMRATVHSPGYRITNTQRIVLNSGVDNIDMSPETGDLYIGSHPRMMLTQHKAVFNCTSTAQTDLGLRYRTFSQKIVS